MATGMFYLTLVTLGVFLLFWFGDLYLTIKTVKHLGRKVEINPIIKFVLRGRGKLIYLFKSIELILFLYLIWFLNNFSGVIPFYILLVFIFLYAMLVVNNAHVYYKVTRKESGIFKFIFVGLVMAILFFIYLNYLLYLDLGVTYQALSESNNKYNELLFKIQDNGARVPTNSTINIPELHLLIRRAS